MKKKILTLILTLSCFFATAQVMQLDGDTDRAPLLGGHPRCNCTSLGMGDHYCPWLDVGIKGACTSSCKCGGNDPDPEPYTGLEDNCAGILIFLACGYILVKKNCK